jgi:hypothetical protein
VDVDQSFVLEFALMDEAPASDEMDVVTPTPLQPGTWYHVRIFRDASSDSIALYLNGTLVAKVEDVTVTTVNGSQQPFFLAADNNSTFGARGPFSGRVDEVKFYWMGLPSSVGEDPVGPRPEGELTPIAPNPWRLGSPLTLRLQTRSPVTMNVYDLSGRLVRTLLGQPRGSGEVVWHWDGRDNTGSRVSSGVYLYEVRAGRETAKGRLLLLK